MLDCEAILSTGVVTVYFAEDGAAQRCAAALERRQLRRPAHRRALLRRRTPRASANGTVGAADADARRRADAADAASVGDATPPEAELGDTTGDEGESGDDGSCGSLAASLSDDDDESDAGDVVSSLREHMLKATARRRPRGEAVGERCRRGSPRSSPKPTRTRSPPGPPAPPRKDASRRPPRSRPRPRPIGWASASAAGRSTKRAWPRS